MKKLTWLGALLGVLGSLLVTAPAQAWEPAGGATFNVPAPWGGYAARYRIITKIEDAIANTPRGETILITSYFLDRDITADRLINACKRGVSVRVVLDSGIKERPARRVIQALNADNVDGPKDKPTAGPCNTALRNQTKAQAEALRDPISTNEALESVTAEMDTPIQWGGDRSYVVQCRDACRSAHGAMHSKFFAFSRTGTANNVVMVSSSNLNKGGAALGWNDMWTMVGRPQSYAKYQQQHLLMTQQKRAGRTRNEQVDGAFVSRFYPIIDAGKAQDPVLGDLNKIRCSSALGRTQVHVSMFWWGGKRGDYLANKLISLGRAGCDVRVIVGAPTKAIITKLRTAARNRRIMLWDSRLNYRGDSLPDVRTHMKSVMVRGAFGGDNSAYWLTTGSANWTTGSLKFSDENTLNITMRRAYSAYRDNWEVIRQHSRRYN